MGDRQKSPLAKSRNDGLNEDDDDHANDARLHLMCYNVLADHLCKPGWFPYRDKAELGWKVRSANIKAAILARAPDVICLQEVQVVHGPKSMRGGDHHVEWFNGWLREAGYTGAFGSRTLADGSQPPGIHLGNAVFFKDESFRPLLVSGCVPLLKTIAEACDGDEALLAEWAGSSARATVATMIAFQCKKSDAVTVVSTTHLPAPRHDEDYGSKLEQLVHAQAWLVEVAKFCAKLTRRSTSSSSAASMAARQGGIIIDTIILAGDLNSLPGGAVYALMERGRVLSSAVRELAKLASFPENRLIPFLEPHTGDMVAPTIENLAPFLGNSAEPPSRRDCYLRSAVKEALGTGNEPAFTNYTRHFVGCLDYIFYYGENVHHPVSSEDPTLTVVKGEYLPDAARGHGSDHVPLACRFHVTAARSKNGADHHRLSTLTPLDALHDDHLSRPIVFSHPETIPVFEGEAPKPWKKRAKKVTTTTSSSSSSYPEPLEPPPPSPTKQHLSKAEEAMLFFT